MGYCLHNDHSAVHIMPNVPSKYIKNINAKQNLSASAQFVKMLADHTLQMAPVILIGKCKMWSQQVEHSEIYKIIPY